MSGAASDAALIQLLRAWTGFERGSKITTRDAADAIERLNRERDEIATQFNELMDAKEKIREERDALAKQVCKLLEGAKLYKPETREELLALWNKIAADEMNAVDQAFLGATNLPQNFLEVRTERAKAATVIAFADAIAKGTTHRRRR